MDVQLTEDQIDLIKSIASDYEDYELEIKPGSSRGDGYLATITTVSIKNKKQKLDLVVKSASSNEKIRKLVPIREAYLTEIYIYDTILPRFDEFQKQNRVSNAFSGYTKMYASCVEEASECLVLKNMKEIGYKLWDRKIPMNSQHVSLVISEYAKFHAVSLAMNDREPELYKSLSRKLEKNDMVNVMFSESMQKLLLDNGSNAVKGNRLASAALKRFFDSFDEFWESLNKREDQLVVLHGDCWCNNMLFKYENSQNVKNPSQVCLLDWQLSKTGSPVLDLAYFLFTCGSKDVLDDSEVYLKLYHETVSANLTEMNCVADKIFPFTLLQRHWKKYAKYGLYMALLLIKFMLNEDDEILDINDAVTDKETFYNNLKRDSINAKDYNQRILEIVCLMAENELI